MGHPLSACFFSSRIVVVHRREEEGVNLWFNGSDANADAGSDVLSLPWSSKQPVSDRGLFS
eukprot:scaffold291949_cov24-Tisochrysis_lutea.AAC.4